MSEPSSPVDKLLTSLQERTKELSCLYQVEELCNQPDATLASVFEGVVKILPKGWQYSDICQASILFEGQLYSTDNSLSTPWTLAADILVHNQVLGRLTVYYTESRPTADVGPFLKEEEQLLQSVARRLGQFALYLQMKSARQELEQVHKAPSPDRRGEWRGPLRLLRQSDRSLYVRIARKLLNYLCGIGIEEAQQRLLEWDPCPIGSAENSGEVNYPGRKRAVDNEWLASDHPFELASKYLTDEEILSRVQRWFQEDNLGAILKVLNNMHAPLPDVADALRRFRAMVAESESLSQHISNGLRVSLTRRILTEQIDFIVVAKEYLDVRDFAPLLDHLVSTPEGQGKLGGKGAGLFLAARILEKAKGQEPQLPPFKIPSTWYVASSGIKDFIVYNDLEEMFEHKYKEVEQIRQDYPNIVQLFKNSCFPPDLVRGLSLAISDLGDVPIIVRSSSLLEDRFGTAFSGKYKSLFLANQGALQERLSALLDAIAEIYASIFSPDPIEYRRQHGLLDFDEEMGVLLQEVVGTRVGRYFLPAFAGVAFSNNEFRWSPRIKREDGLIRLVPGLGTRAVDRLGDDYPILAVPGQPNLRVNVSIEELLRYCPRQIDVINLQTGSFQTLAIQDLLLEVGSEFPAFESIFSLLRDNHLTRPLALLFDPETDQAVATFDGLITNSHFVQKTGSILKVLQEALGHPVDIEFAHDGTDFYLLQCRPQYVSQGDTPAPIPKDIHPQDIVFTANQHVSNGWIPDITHVVYVDPMRYGDLPSRQEMLSVGRAISRLNTLLPKRQFILMGPGRWGSRGDIKLGVSVTYSDINNTAMLVEIARKKGNYVPDLSFGTHFFQDLVESSIRYLPLYPDNPGIFFNERLLRGAPNLLPKILPEFASLADTIRVVDIPATTGDRILRILMNADLEEAIGFLTSPGERKDHIPEYQSGTQHHADEHWRWRWKMAAQVASDLDPARFGVQALYLFGSTKNASAGPGSDIDLLLHIRSTPAQRQALLDWLEGWSLCLSEVNYLKTGYRTNGLLDIHLVTDQDIAKRTSFAVKINAITDPARRLALKGEPPVPV
ncbi:MAG: hypothetical protein JW797_19455 [Bradymonadales bacterium]|nr:hypothetical protein [Bradymonadales bacterium]